MATRRAKPGAVASRTRLAGGASPEPLQRVLEGSPSYGGAVQGPVGGGHAMLAMRQSSARKTSGLLQTLTKLEHESETRAYELINLRVRGGLGQALYVSSVNPHDCAMHTVHTCMCRHVHVVTEPADGQTVLRCCLAHRMAYKEVMQCGPFSRRKQKTKPQSA